MADLASRCAIEAADGTKEEGTAVMPKGIPDPSEKGGVEAMRTGKGNTPRNAGIVARKSTRRVNVGRSVPIRRKQGPGPDPV